MRSTKARNLYNKVRCSWFSRLLRLDTGGGGSQFPLKYMEKPRPRTTTQTLYPCSGQCQACPELHRTKMLSVSYSVHPEIPQTISISTILSLTGIFYTFLRHIFHCLPTENTSLFPLTYSHKNILKSRDSYSFPICNFLWLF